MGSTPVTGSKHQVLHGLHLERTMQVSEIISFYMASIETKATYRTDKYMYKALNALWGSIEHSDFSVIHLNQYKNKRLLEVNPGMLF